MQCLYCILSFFIVFVIKKRERERAGSQTHGAVRSGVIFREKRSFANLQVKKILRLFFLMLRN